MEQRILTSEKCESTTTAKLHILNLKNLIQDLKNYNLKKRKKIKYKIPLVLTLSYWLPSSLVLLFIVKGADDFIPIWLSTFLMPGHILGFGLGFVGGTIALVIGQIISFFIIFGILSALSDVINQIRKEERDRKIKTIAQQRLSSTT